LSYRKILHIDLDAFFCSVEELFHPELKGKAFAVGGSVENRGVISSCSYAARMFGVHSAMPTGKAKLLCPELVLVSSSYSRYQEASQQVMSILSEVTPLIEQISIDEAFLEVSDLLQSGLEIAQSLQQSILIKTGLPSSIGVASNMLVAKIANDYGKQKHKDNKPPMAVTVVQPGKEAEFLAPLTVISLWGIGPKSAEKLEGLGIKTIGDLAKTPIIHLEKVFGINGHELLSHAQGIDNRPVLFEHEIKSISQEITFSRDCSDIAYLESILRDMSEQVGLRLRKSGFCGYTIRLKLRWPDFRTITRQVTLGDATDQDDVIFRSVHKLFMNNWEPDQKVRLLGVGVSGLQRSFQQLTLWETPDEKERRLLLALDELRSRFGKKIVSRGSKI